MIEDLKQKINKDESKMKDMTPRNNLHSPHQKMNFAKDIDNVEHLQKELNTLEEILD